MTDQGFNKKTGNIVPQGEGFDRRNLSKPVIESQTPKGCRFIHGDVKDGNWRYCQTRQKPGSPYCPKHHDLCRPPEGSDSHEEAKATILAAAKSRGFPHQGRIA